jgi:RNA recognition motif-containing protein
MFILENDECDIMKRSLCTDPDIDEYSMKATRTLYIGNLQSEISYNELREAYSAFGDIIVCIKLLFSRRIKI